MRLCQWHLQLVANFDGYSIDVSLISKRSPVVMFPSKVGDGVDEDAFNRMGDPGWYPCECRELLRSRSPKLCLGFFLRGKRTVKKRGQEEKALASYALRAGVLWFAVAS